MKKSVKYIIIVITVIVIAALAYWEYNKKGIIKQVVENTISNKTDSLYYIHYDSSAIDAASGSASFYNVSLQSDSLQKQLLQFDSASAQAIYNIHVAEVNIRGANIPALLSNEKVDANSIKIIRPVINIIEAGTKKQRAFNRTDTLALYEKLLGKFNSIHAGEIIIEDGELNLSRKTDNPYISLSGVNINIKNVLIDSSKDYDNIISYFIKDVDATVKKIHIQDDEHNSSMLFSGLEYNAAKKLLSLGNFQQKNNNSARIAFNINNTYLKGLNTDSFILKKQLKADELICDGGIMTFYRKKNKTNSNDIIAIDNNFFDEAQLNKITLNNTKVVVYNRDKPKDQPFELTNIKFNASDIQHLYSGTSIKNLVGRANWNLSADGFSFITSNKIYKLSIGAFNINKATGKIHLGFFSVMPQMSEATYVKNLKEQTDLYDVTINNIDLTGVDIKKLITDKIFIAETATIHPVLQISNDRTVTPSTKTKVGNYPHQLIQKMKFPLYVNKIIVKDGYIAYTERGAKSGQQGIVFFNHANGIIENVTNIKEHIAKNSLLILNARAQFLGVSDLQTRWNLPLNTVDGAFTISGNAGDFNAEKLDPLIEPLALASIKKGEIKHLDFSMSGNDGGAKGTSTLLYNDLKIEALKKDSNDLKKRELISFFANLIIKDNNPQNGVLRKGEIDIQRDTTRSFFNLVWKGIFKAAKRTAMGKNDEK